MPKKCSNPDHNSPPKDSAKRNKRKKKPNLAQINCPVCECAIIEEDEKKGVTGDDALLYEGKCNAWTHRICLGFNKQAYEALSESDSPYFCPHCMINKQTQEIDSLKQLVKTLTNDLALIKNQLSASRESLGKNFESCDDRGISTDKNIITETKSNSNRHQFTSNASPSYFTTDRKYNVIVYGIDENPPNTKRHVRLKNDIEAFHNALAKASIQIEPNAIKDCYRLGQYKSRPDYPRPLLIKFLRSTDATYLLTITTQLEHPIYIKPDLAPLEKSNESLLLKERKSLIQKGTDRQHIKLRNSHLYVNDQLFVKVENGQLCYCSPPLLRSSSTTSTFVDMVVTTVSNPNNHSQDKPNVAIPAESNVLPSNVTNNTDQSSTSNPDSTSISATASSNNPCR